MPASSSSSIGCAATDVNASVTVLTRVDVQTHLKVGKGDFGSRCLLELVRRPGKDGYWPLI
jgi:hypothetical protein